MSVWKTLSCAPIYEVGECGNIRNASTRVIVKPYTHKDGYCYYRLHLGVIDGKKARKSISGHKAVITEFIGERPSVRHEVAHGDGNRQNNAISNLRWATHSENELDKRIHGTALIGEKHHSSILTKENVVFIRSEERPLVKSRLMELARMFSVNPKTIQYVFYNRNSYWAHV